MASRIIVVLAVLVSSAAVFTSTASAYTWKTDEKWAFIDAHADDFKYDGYRWPNLLAECLQKSAAKTFRSYTAWVYANDRAFARWTHSESVTHCQLVYGKKLWD